MAIEGKSVGVQTRWHDSHHRTQAFAEHLNKNWQGYLSLMTLGLVAWACASGF